RHAAAGRPGLAAAPGRPHAAGGAASARPPARGGPARAAARDRARWRRARGAGRRHRARDRAGPGGARGRAAPARPRAARAAARPGAPRRLRARPRRAAQHPSARAPPGLRLPVVRARRRGDRHRPGPHPPQVPPMNTPVPPPAVPVRQRNRNRALLVLIVVVFLGSAVVAGALRFSGWRPAGMKNHGELLQPPGDLRTLAPRLADGGEYRWNPAERTWRILVAVPASCTDACVALSRDLDKVWRL